MYASKSPNSAGPKSCLTLRCHDLSPRVDEVLIKAEAIGVNFIDTYFRSGLYPHKLPFVLGAEVAGTVEAVGCRGNRIPGG